MGLPESQQRTPEPPREDTGTAARSEPGAFDLSVRVSSGSGEVILSGELDVASAPRVGETLDWLCEQGCREIVVDLADVSFVDSSGLAAFVRAHQALQHSGGRLTLRRPGHSMRRLLTMTGLTGEFRIQ
ncbi:MAG TPA: STAS domain-containing protein [Mycobacteriales bacterium]|nr:STAS domain-containing protein [Mycobacteriales bacterium]